MKRLLLTLAVVAVAVASCQKDVVYHDTPEQNQSVELAYSNTRSYDEALEIAEGALKLLDGDDTRSTTKRVIKRSEGQTVMRPVTRGGEVNDEPIMYVFNNEDNQGFTIIAADRSQQPIIAVTEYGNYTYGEPTGVEPFDLLMEDVATSLSILPEDPLAIRIETTGRIENFRYGPTTNVQWGTGSIYGSMYPDGVAYVEAAAIAQAIMGVPANTYYTITNPDDALYGHTITLDVQSMCSHIRDDYHGNILHPCTDDIHNDISRLYLEIGYRLSNGTNIGLSDKTTPFTLSKMRSVLASFGVTAGDNTYINSFPWFAPTNPMIMILPTYSLFVYRGKLGGVLSKKSHTWLATGCYYYHFYEIEFTLNRILNPNHPDPTGYTETNRELKYDAMYYMNWGYDGYSNGWFAAGCFDMSKRETIPNYMPEIPERSTLNYNFSDVQLFEVINDLYNIN